MNPQGQALHTRAIGKSIEVFSIFVWSNKRKKKLLFFRFQPIAHLIRLSQSTYLEFNSVSYSVDSIEVPGFFTGSYI